MMGAGITLVAARAGLDVVLIDRDQALADKGKAYTAETLGDAAADPLDRILATDDFARLDGCDLVIEAVFEDSAIKADTIRKAEAVIGADAIYASNTSTLPISRLAEASSRPRHFIGLHFFSPVERMPLVEVILGRETAPETLAYALDFVARLRKVPIVVNDSRGFYTSRVFQTLIHEGAAMLGEGVAPALIENAAKAAGFPVGPLALLDEVTLDLPLKIVEQALAEEGARYVPPPGTAVMRKMASLGRTSRKAGGAFYDYPENGRKHLWPEIAIHFPPVAGQPDVEELKRRFLYVQALETVRCLDEQVLTTVQDADLGAVFGWGFPAWAGGTISYIDTVGVGPFVREADRLAQLHGPRFAPPESLRQRGRTEMPFYADEGAACAA
jgi:3-hydroxyacyl-CoA dehydrogenase/enoyl-CoA hydratase/3-hydroxybutyryl-CoA epimerase